MNDKNKDILNPTDEAEEDQKHRNMRAGKGFYAVCAVCLLAIGIASWAAFSSLDGVQVKNSSNESNVSSNCKPKPVSSTPSKNNESKTPNESKNTPSKTVSEPKTDPAATDAAPVATFFLMPMQQGKIYKDFSDTSLQFSNTYSDYRLHAAVDITSAESSNVKACGDGIVTEIKKDGLLGTVIVIDHGNGIIARYCGLKENVNVKKGDKVSSTTLIGSLDTVPSECLDPAHLHLEFLKDGKPVSASKLFK